MTLRTLGAFGTARTLRAAEALRPKFTLWTLGAARTLLPGLTLRALIPLWAAGTLWAGVSLRT